MSDVSKFSTTLRVGQSLQIGDAIVTVCQKDGQSAKLEVVAPRSTKIVRPITNHSAQECASSPSTGKEQSHGEYAV